MLREAIETDAASGAEKVTVFLDMSASANGEQYVASDCDEAQLLSSLLRLVEISANTKVVALSNVTPASLYSAEASVVARLRFGDCPESAVQQYVQTHIAPLCSSAFSVKDAADVVWACVGGRVDDLAAVTHHLRANSTQPIAANPARAISLPENKGDAAAVPTAALNDSDDPDDPPSPAEEALCHLTFPAACVAESTAHL